ncbi:polyisoprenoid-binding protein YceI [Arcicella aurantiaca]|uniref:Polyisoprenoid-binding protein YceI n=1 Tax=Arcicella aurantiaca TaxID=591202 RepID=A0A316DQZ7_9BACT|nr:YceI family protein [Arcicella aurantiaca]PWK20256.1 polyisoprenoid-binding protein YceI [Arcicella aurantiaca]
MKKIAILSLVMLASLSSFAQKWNVDKSHSKIGFTVTHLLISEVDGNFKKFDATITSSKDDFSDAVFDLTADISSISTDNEMRDGHLKKPDMFDAEKFPTFTFKSTSIKKIDAKKFKLDGNLTLKGVTKPVSFDLTLSGIGKNMRTQKPIAGFKLTGTIKRTDFGVGGMPDSVVSENIEVRAVGEFGKE